MSDGLSQSFSEPEPSMPEQEVSGEDPQEHPAEAEADPEHELEREPEPLPAAPGCPRHSKYSLGTSIRTPSPATTRFSGTRSNKGRKTRLFAFSARRAKHAAAQMVVPPGQRVNAPRTLRGVSNGCSGGLPCANTPTVAERFARTIGNVTAYTTGQAARAVSKAKSTISKDICRGRISAPRPRWLGEHRCRRALPRLSGGA